MPSLRFFVASFYAVFCFVSATFVMVSSAVSAEEFSPVSAKYLVKDPTSTLGYKETLAWTINSQSDWSTFYNTLPYLPADKTLSPDPLQAKVEDMIVLSQNDASNITGFDIYLSSKGIMAVDRISLNSYYPDTFGFWKFLTEQQSKLAPLELLSAKSSIDPRASGIVAIYSINRNLSNPMWNVKDPEQIKVYNSFVETLKPYTDFEIQFSAPVKNFDLLGNFVINFNYPGAKANTAVVTSEAIRMSNVKITTKYYQDPNNFYNFYKGQARDMLQFGTKYKNIRDFDDREF